MSNYYSKIDTTWKLIKNWHTYNSNILTYLQNTKMDFIVLKYDDFMIKQSEFERLQDFVGIELQDKRNISLYRHRKRKQHFTLVNILEWLNYAQTGYHLADIVRQLDELN